MKEQVKNQTAFETYANDRIESAVLAMVKIEMLLSGKSFKECIKSVSEYVDENLTATRGL